MSIILPPDVEAIVSSHVSSGEFSSPSEMVAAAVRLLDQRNHERARQEQKLRSMLQEAVDEMDRGEGLDVDEAFDQVEVKLFGHKLDDE